MVLAISVRRPTSFVDWLASTGCKLWQVLPLGPTGYGDLPYQCFSAFAGNPYLISFDALIEDGLLTEDDFVSDADFSATLVDFGTAHPLEAFVFCKKLFPASIHRLNDFPSRNLNASGPRNASWLDDYALVMSIKEANGGGAWNGGMNHFGNVSSCYGQGSFRLHAENI